MPSVVGPIAETQDGATNLWRCAYIVIGSGAREHALLLALRNDPDVETR